MSVYDLKHSPLLPTRDRLARVWVISDIQPAEPAEALATLSAAVDDIQKTGMAFDAVWLLGDAFRGSDLPAIEQIADIFIEQLARLGAPVCYLLGNHDVDLKRATDVDRHPLRERARAEANWHVAEGLADFFFTRRIGEWLVVFMGDHAHDGGAWFTSHGGVSGRARDRYPHDEASYERLTRAIAEFGGPVVIASHYALPGGQKPSGLMSRLLPLPDNVKLVLHGHAHIGDLVWNKDNPWQRDNPVDGHAVRQFNISALETVRSPGSHSAVLELAPSGPVSLRIRCHQERAWVAEFPLGEGRG